MFKVLWDKKTGGIMLTNKVLPDVLGVSPRPVFFEELDLLKLNKLGWSYPHCKEPLLWACNKQYFYRGEFVFEVKGANLYNAPQVLLQSGFENISLKPVDVEAMLERCKDYMFLAESEAIEFIRDTYLQYASARHSVDKVKANQLDFEALAAKAEKSQKRKMAIVKQDCDSFDIMPFETAKEEGKKVYQTTKIDVFLASFSGGKDSQVVLDLCTRAIPPSDFEVIYSDTGYELPSSLALYEEVKAHYHELFPELRFRTARNHESVLNYWDKIGTPSDTHRWCCSVMKTAPLYRMLKIEGTNRQAKVLTFDGVRAEESTRRSNYSRIGRGVKHDTVVNASPILEWNTTEIFLYLFGHSLPINFAYRLGMTRVGCLICPFSSEWNEMVASNCFSENLHPFLCRIENSVQNSGIQDVQEYIKAGNWKRRAGGRGIKTSSFLEIVSIKPDLRIKCVNPEKDLLTWLTAIGDYTISNNSDPNQIKGELLFQKQIWSFTIKQTNKASELVFYNTYNNPVLQGLIKRALYKATYCINCESCEVECPTGALSILPSCSIDKSLCIHCQKCLLFHALGCIVANSLNISENNNKMKLVSYNNFGLREEWLDMFLSSPDTYFSDNNHGLHPKEQLPNFVKWLYHANIIDDLKTRNLTDFGKLLYQIHVDMSDLMWELIWVNLSIYSPIAKWYKESVDWNYSFSQQDIQELVKNDYPNDSATTIKNIVYALFRTFKETPIGEMGLLREVDKLRYVKAPCESISRETVAYSMYKYGEENSINSFRVSDLYSYSKSGIFKEFGITRSELESHLRSLNSENNRILTAELNMGLDHITLREDLNAVTALTILVQ